MSEKKRVEKYLSDVIQGLDMSIPYYPDLARCLDDNIPASIMAAQLYFWSQICADKDGWVYKTQAEWKSKVGFTRDTLKTATMILRSKGVLKVDVRRVESRSITCSHYQLNINALKQFVENQQPETQVVDVEKQQSTMLEINSTECGKPTPPNAGNQQRKTESSSEITSEIEEKERSGVSQPSPFSSSKQQKEELNGNTLDAEPEMTLSEVMDYLVEQHGREDAEVIIQVEDKFMEHNYPSKKWRMNLTGLAKKCISDNKYWESYWLFIVFAKECLDVFGTVPLRPKRFVKPVPRCLVVDWQNIIPAYVKKNPKCVWNYLLADVDLYKSYNWDANDTGDVEDDEVEVIEEPKEKYSDGSVFIAGMKELAEARKHALRIEPRAH